MAADRDKAEQVIVEILRQAGPDGLGRVKLYKTFWLAHLYYATSNPGYLTDWPIVRMPQGPGIDDGRDLLAHLESIGAVTQTDERVGPFPEKRSRYAKPGQLPELPAVAVDAIRSAVEFVKGCKTAAEMSEISHDYSRSWRGLFDGREMDIYTDLIPDEEYAERMASLDGAAAALDDLFR